MTNLYVKRDQTCNKSDPFKIFYDNINYLAKRSFSFANIS